MNKAESIRQIVDGTSYRKLILHPQHPERGQFVVTGPQAGTPIEKYVGYCVQVRKNSGAFGSHVVLLRHCDGSLTCHENQAFVPMDEAQESMARPLFEVLPEDEDYPRGYSIRDQNHETDFVVERVNNDEPLSVARSDAVAIVTETRPDGTRTLTSFI